MADYVPADQLHVPVIDGNYGYPSSDWKDDGNSFNFPSFVDTGDISYPIAPDGNAYGEPLGVNIPQGTFMDYTNTDAFPDKVNGTQPTKRGMFHPRGIEPENSNSWSRTPAPGSQDLIAPRATGSHASFGGNYFNGSGPVSGKGSNFSGTIAALDPVVLGSPGPVRGGRDYSTQAANAYFSTQAQQYSAQAVEAALISAI